MSCGRPDVVFLDEPTTGVDVGTRKFIWSQIQKSIGGRVILLTTHYMDEADALAHRIGIMANGRLRVLGSAQHLKSRHGGGYRVELKGSVESADKMAALIAEVFPQATLLERHAGRQTYEVRATFDLGRAFRALEQARTDGDVETYSLSQTNLEQVFLNIAEQAAKGKEQIEQQVAEGAVEPLQAVVPAA